MFFFFFKGEKQRGKQRPAVCVAMFLFFIHMACEQF